MPCMYRCGARVWVRLAVAGPCEPAAGKPNAAGKSEVLLEISRLTDKSWTVEQRLLIFTSN